MTDSLSTRDIEAWLDWLAMAGIEDAAGDLPADWFELARRQAAASSAREPAPPAARAPARPSSPRAHVPSREPAPPAAPRPVRPPPPSSDPAAMSARAEAKAARTLPELLAILQRFEGCGLKKTAKNLCFYRGAGQARLMLIGEAPGRDEDLHGKPFVGRAGQLLDRMLSAIGLTEQDVHITNIVYWRPPGNRTPTPQEAQACQPFLERQIELVAPELILILGGAAAKQLLDTADGIMKVRGKWRALRAGGREHRALATLHPAYLLRTPAHKRLAWRDLLMVDEALSKPGQE